MRGIASGQWPARQRGMALLGLLALVSAAIIFAYVTGLNRSAAGMAQARAQKTSIALAQAKEALIAYAVTYGDDPDHVKVIPGYLPCPDIGGSTEGEAASACGSFLVSVMGRLPWKTLGLDAPKDGSGECLWYAVSGTYKNNPNGVTKNNVLATDPTANNLMNWDTNGQFNVVAADGSTLLAGSANQSGADTRAVAVIFAPGVALPGQDRTPVANTPVCGGNPNSPAAYLDVDAASGINNSTLVTPTSPTHATDVSSFITGAGSASFNDQLVYITRADIWNAIKKRSDFDPSNPNSNLRKLTRRAAECTAMYGTKNGAGDKRLPWASNPSMSDLSYYAVNRRYRDVIGMESGRLSYRVNRSDAVTINALVTNADPVLDTAPGDTPYSNFLLLTSLNAPLLPGSYCNYTADEKTWYNNWKDHLFYAVANEYSPTNTSTSTSGCDSTKCLTINGDYANYYAAVVIFAGEKLSGQNRNTLSNKGTISNYLEGRNSSNHTDLSKWGHGDYQGASADSAFNDIVYAIHETTLAVSSIP